MPDQLDVGRAAWALSRTYHDLFYQCTGRLKHLGLIAAFDRCPHHGHPPRKDLGKVGEEHRRGSRLILKICQELRPTRLEFLELALQAWRPQAVRDGLDQIVELALDALEFPLLGVGAFRRLTLRPVPFHDEGLAKGRDAVGAHQAAAKRLHDHGFQLRASDRAGVHTALAAPGPLAAEIIPAQRGVRATAGGAYDLAGQEVPGASPLPKGRNRSVARRRDLTP